MDIVVFVVGSLAAVLCGWFALQIVFKLLVGSLKLGLLVALAYFAAQVTWINAETPEVVSTDVARLVEFVENKWTDLPIPSVKVKFNYPEKESAPSLSSIGLSTDESSNESNKSYF